MSVLSNPKHELTAQELAKGKTQVEAIEAAGYSPHRSNASRLIANDNIKSRVQELQMEASKTIAITLEGQIAKLEDLLNQAKQLKQISAGVAAIDKQNELMGFEDTARREQARGRVCKHERRRAKAICVWKQGVRQLGHVGIEQAFSS